MIPSPSWPGLPDFRSNRSDDLLIVARAEPSPSRLQPWQQLLLPTAARGPDMDLADGRERPPDRCALQRRSVTPEGLNEDLAG